MMIKNCATLIVLLVIIVINLVSSEFASVTWNSITKKYRIQNGILQHSVAIANCSDEMNTNGWIFLHIKTNENYPDQVQAYAAGLLEGHFTRTRIHQQWHNLAENYCDNEETYCSKLKKFLDQNMDYMNQQIKIRRDFDPYFHHVALVLEQQSGIEDGLNSKPAQPRTWINSMGFMFLNLFGDSIELETIFGRKVSTLPFGFTPCSALIKVLENNKDLYFSHVSWYLYRSMLRILKHYDFSFHVGMQEKALIPGKEMTFSSRPGTIPSLDDFYVISSGLAVSETSNSNYNNDLWKNVKPRNAILTWIRGMVSCRLAKNGREWAMIFGSMNSGTYNNEWMILDYNKFEPGNPLPNDLLWILEQMPNDIRAADVTDVLKNQGYWPSYNIPYFENENTKLEEQEEKYGDYFSYERSPRTQIFKRDHGKVHDIASMIELMRYNNYTTDPLSQCDCTPPYSAVNAISSRADLNPKNGTYPFEGLGHGPFGAVDMKLTTSKLFKELQVIAINGPTYDPLPPFQWSKSDFDNTTRHLGHPDLWKFDPVLFPTRK